MKLSQVVGIIAMAFLFLAIYLVFSYAPIETTMLEVQKIFYFHVSSALTVFLAFGVTCLFSLLYLLKRKDKFDTVAAASAELGIVFCTDRVTHGTHLGEACMEYVVEHGNRDSQARSFSG